MGCQHYSGVTPGRGPQGERDPQETKFSIPSENHEDKKILDEHLFTGSPSIQNLNRPARKAFI